jgi:hypothetical protein
MKNTPFIFTGAWRNETSTSITVTVDGQSDPITVGSNSTSLPMILQLSGWLTLDVVLANSDGSSNPILLWEDPNAEQIVILQQVARHDPWVAVKVKHQGLPFYMFHLIEEDGLLIVGTVELIDPVQTA